MNTCPLCRAEASYVGPTVIHCIRPACSNYVEEVDLDAPEPLTFQAFPEILDKIYEGLPDPKVHLRLAIQKGEGSSLLRTLMEKAEESARQKRVEEETHLLDVAAYISQILKKLHEDFVEEFPERKSQGCFMLKDDELVWLSRELNKRIREALRPAPAKDHGEQ